MTFLLGSGFRLFYSWNKKISWLFLYSLLVSSKLSRIFETRLISQHPLLFFISNFKYIDQRIISIFLYFYIFYFLCCRVLILYINWLLVCLLPSPFPPCFSPHTPFYYTSGDQIFHPIVLESYGYYNYYEEDFYTNSKSKCI